MPAKRVERREIQQRLERTASDYIQDALESLGVRETMYRWTGLAWYVAGFLALIAGIWTAVALSRDAMGRLNGPNSLWPLFAYLALKSMIIIGLLVATSKYSFTLGRSYMSESLKNSDRKHAISFGNFYLRAYGDKATWQEIKEAFQHWNIAKGSAFATLDPREFDPDFLGMAVKLARAMLSKETDREK
jgi:hypothetical protein